MKALTLRLASDPRKELPTWVRAPSFTIQRSIAFPSRSGRGKLTWYSVDELKDYQLRLIDERPDDGTILYSNPKHKDDLVAAVRGRIDAQKAEKLKKARDGGAGYHTHSTRYVVANYPRPSTPDRSALSDAYSELEHKVVEPRSPIDYSAFPPSVVHSPGGTEARRSGAYGSQSPGGSFHGVAIWTSNYPTHLPALVQGPAEELAKTPIPSTGTKDSGWQVIDLARLKRWAGERKGYKPGRTAADGERSDQGAAMGNISAGEAAAAAGYGNGHWEWLHLLAFALGGIGETRINHPDNLVAGTVGANRVHKVLEDSVRALLTQKITATVSVRARAEVLADSYHLGVKLEYALRFEVGMVSTGNENTFYSVIDPRDPNPAQGGNMDILVKTLSTLPGFGYSAF